MPTTQKAIFGGTPSEYGPRAIAYLIDVAIGLAPTLVLSLVGLVFVFIDGVRAVGVALFVIAGMYAVGFPIVNFLRQAISGSTFGKSRQGLKLVVDASGEPIGLLYALLRSGIFWVLNLFTGGIFLLIDYLAPAFNSKRQRLVDKIVGTVVVTSRSVELAASVTTRADHTEISAPLPPPTLG